MNKLELIEALREEAGITKNEAEVVVNMVFDEMSNAMANGDRVEIRGFAHFMLNSIRHTRAGIRKPAKKLKLSQKNFRFSSSARN